MPMLRKLSYFFSVCLALLSLAACSPDVAEQTDPTEPTVCPLHYVRLEGDAEFIDFDAKANSRELVVESSLPEWEAELQPAVDWLSISREGTALRCTLQEHRGMEPRSVKLILRSRDCARSYTIRQLGALPTILVNKSELSIGAEGGALDFVITTNVSDYELRLPEWIKQPEARSVMRDIPVALRAEPNTSGSTRGDNIEIVERGATGREAVRASLSVLQLSAEGAGATATGADLRVPIARGEATSVESGYGIERAFDGNRQTYYHSNRTNTDPKRQVDIENYFPITLTFELARPESLDYMLLLSPPQSIGSRIKTTELYYSTDGKEYKSLGEYSLEEGDEPTRVSLAGTNKERITHIRLRVLSGHGAGQGFAALAELELYRHSPNRFDPLTLFTDQSCSELRAGVQRQTIESCPDKLYRDIAMALHEGRYQSEFRIGSYRAYPNSFTHLASNKMQFAYSQLDNPTGIAVEAGEELKVLVGDTWGHESLALRVVDYYQGGQEDGVSQSKTYLLSQGLNSIKMSAPGLVYVSYIKRTIEEATSAKPIKIHFVSGTVNGYFDAQSKQHQGRWQELLGRAKHRYFDLLGRKAHLVFPVAVYRKATPDGQELAGLYDSIVQAQQELHGLVRYGRTYSNRLLYSPTYRKGSYMYATHEHTAYVEGTLHHIADPVSLRNGVWGPAHETGHVHQTVPGVLWQGLTECTVNIPTLYVQTAILGRESRLQSEPSGQSGHNSYTGAFTHIIARKAAHATDESVFRKLVPFWQLQLYFGNVLGRSPHLRPDKGGFYPELYEYCRTHPSIVRQGAMTEDRAFNGACQLEFVYMASVVSGYDLVDFFEKWGFLRPVSALIKDYDQEWLVVTQPQIDALKRRIAAERLRPLGKVPIEYITDRNTELFRQPRAIVEGTAKRVGNEVSFSGWRNVVAFEVLDERGQLVFVSDGVWTNGRGYRDEYYLHVWVDKLVSWRSGYRVQAVAADGTRVPVSITE